VNLGCLADLCRLAPFTNIVSAVEDLEDVIVLIGLVDVQGQIAPSPCGSSRDVPQ
jgi:hypothetical protein